MSTNARATLTTAMHQRHATILLALLRVHAMLDIPVMALTAVVSSPFGRKLHRLLQCNISNKRKWLAPEKIQTPNQIMQEMCFQCPFFDILFPETIYSYGYNTSNKTE